MASVINKVESLSLDSERHQAWRRLQDAEKALSNEVSGGNSQSSHRAQLEVLSALTDLNRFFDVYSVATKAAYAGGALNFAAYALYRQGKVTELRKLLSGKELDSTNVGAFLSWAQAEYKANNLDSARRLLTQCRSKISSEDEGDLAINLGAVEALGGYTSDAKSKSFDENFNNAYAYLVRGLSAKALEELQEAKGRAEEDEDRQASISQAAYAHLIAGEKETAAQLIESLSLSNAPLELQLVAANNKLASEFQGGDLLNAHKALLSFDEFVKHGHFAELNLNQRRLMQSNHLRLLARAGVQGSLGSARKYQREFDYDIEPLTVAYRYFVPKRSLQKLANANDVAASCTLSSLEGKPWQYSSEQLQRLTPGDFGCLANAVDMALNDKNKDELNDFFTALKSDELKQFGYELLNPASAVKADALASIKEKISSVDLQSLEREVPSFDKPHESSSNVVKVRKHKSKSGKRKLPADFDASREPDPERWLAKQDRSDYKPKKKKATQATQGSAGSAAVAISPEQSASQVVGAKTKRKSNKKKSKK